MPSSIASLLAGLFPALATDSPLEPDCWVARVLKADPPELARLSSAIDVVGLRGQLPILRRRIANEHPTRRAHRAADDLRLLDCLTEALAFAWAESSLTGSPSLTANVPGAPDVYVDTGARDTSSWIEAKAIHASERDRQLTRWMRKTGEVVLGTVEPAGRGLWNKFVSDFYDAKRKFDKNTAGKHIVFFNVTFDTDLIPRKQETFDQADTLATALEAREPSIKIVICYNYSWLEPIRNLQ